MSEMMELVKKNFKNLVRAKSGSLVVILGPLIVIFLAGLAFDNTNAYAVKVGAFRPDGSELTGKFLDQLRSQFKVIEYSSERECVEAIKSTDVNTCMIFASNFKIGVPAQNQITFYVDYSRINLVWAVMRVMTERVGEEALEAGVDLTKALLDAIEFTQMRIGDERELVVRLTTENELLKSNAQDLMAELGDMDLGFDESAFPLDDVSSSKTQVKQWVDNALSLGDRGLSKATSFIDAADSIVKGSSVSTDAKAQLLANFQKSVDDIRKLQADFAATKNLTQQSFLEFDKRMTDLAEGISATKNKLHSADTSREFSLRVLETLSLLLDKSLISVLGVQQALNDIDRKIGSIEIRDPGAIAQPIVTSIKPVVKEKTYLNYLFPVLIVLVVMFTSLLVTPTLVLLDRNSPASFRTFMTPVKDVSYVLANFLTSFALLFVQVLVVLAIAGVFFSGDVSLNVPKALVLLMLVSSLFILFGMIVGYAFKSEETATLASVSLGALFLFVSDVIIPLESMPEAFAYIASFNPYVLGSSLLRRTLLFDSSVLSLLPDVLILIGYIIASALIVMGVYLLTRRYSLEQLLKGVAPVLVRMRLRRAKND